MKSIFYIVVSAFVLLLPQSLLSCSIGPYPASGYLLIRAYDYNQDKQSEQMGNCLLWQKYTGGEVDTESILEAVYHIDYDAFLKYASSFGKASNYEPLMNNAFIRWLDIREDERAFRLLLLAKKCEQVRSNQNSPWYYPYQGDDVRTQLLQIKNESLQYHEGKLLDRYTLQAVRAMFSLEEYGKCINLWQVRSGKIADGLIKRMIEGYVAGAMMRTGDVLRALQIFAKLEDLDSIYFCARQLGLSTRTEDIMNLIYEHNPDSRNLMRFADKILRSMMGVPGYYDEQPESCYSQLKVFTNRVIKEQRAEDLAPWYYVKAYCLALEKSYQEASKVLAVGEKYSTSDFMASSIHVLRFFLDAQSLPVNASYDQVLLAHMRWLDEKIAKNITPSVANIVINSYELEDNRSFYYWNDMLRKVLTGVAAPRYLVAGQPVRAMQVANYATYRLVNLVKYYGSDKQGRPMLLEQYRTRGEFNGLDYSTDFFHLIDSVDVRSLIRFSQRMKHPMSSFDHFVQARGYFSVHFLNEVIGTKFMRTEEYAKAAEYLAKVPSAYQYRLNTCRTGCMKYDPFDSSRLLKDITDYKYRFATKMSYLQQEMHSNPDPNRRAMMKLYYMIGYRNSFDLCWALTQYVLELDYVGYRYDNWYIPPHPKEIETYCKRLEREAFDEITDTETDAAAHLLMQYYGTVCEKQFENTVARDYIRSYCDTEKDYKERSCSEVCLLKD